MPDHDIHSLSFGDALFLYFERDGQPLNVASLTVFEGEIPLELCTQFIESKLPLIPRYRQHLVTPPLNLGVPSWQYDPDFDIRNHVREVVLKHGTDAELRNVASAILSTNLDRARPLWDFTVMHGLKGNRTGALIRMHHCLADGISGIGLMNVLMDASPVCAPLPKPKPFHVPPAQPSGTGMPLLDGLINSFMAAAERVVAAQSELLKFADFVANGEQPRNGDAGAVDPAMPKMTISEFTRMVPELASPSPRLPFNAICRGPQKFEWMEIPLADLKAIKNVCGTTLNDVLLSVFAATVRDYSALHGVQLEGRTVRVVVPVNIRGNNNVSDLGNQITFLPVDIPLDIKDPLKLVAAVNAAMVRLKGARIAELVGLVGTLVTTIPNPLQAILGPIASQLPLSFLCNTICTNVPGPQFPLYLLGRKMLATYPYVPIGGEMGMNCAVMTYDGKAFFGFSGDANAIPDIEHLPKFLKANFAQLKKAAKVRPVRHKRARPKQRVKTTSAPTPEADTPMPAKEVAIPKGVQNHADTHEETKEKVLRAVGTA